MRTARVTVELEEGGLNGDIALPDAPRGMVLFAHGSGSSRLSPRNRAVAAGLNRQGLGTLLLDLLTEDEELIDAQTGALRFDIGLLSRRLAVTIDWLGEDHTVWPGLARLPLGLFGASTGAAGALVAAAERPERVRAVVSRGGRPDLAGPSLERVGAPVLLIVGGRDTSVLELNERARQRLAAENDLRVVARATHLFEEPGALEQVTELAANWFRRYLPLPARTAGSAG